MNRSLPFLMLAAVVAWGQAPAPNADPYANNADAGKTQIPIRKIKTITASVFNLDPILLCRNLIVWDGEDARKLASLRSKLSNLFLPSYPGRCPGLSCSGLSGRAKTENERRVSIN